MDVHHKTVLLDTLKLVWKGTKFVKAMKGLAVLAGGAIPVVVAILLEQPWIAPFGLAVLFLVMFLTTWHVAAGDREALATQKAEAMASPTLPEHTRQLKEILESLRKSIAASKPLKYGDRPGGTAKQEAVSDHFPDLSDQLDQWNTALESVGVARKAVTTRVYQELSAVGLGGFERSITEWLAPMLLGERRSAPDPATFEFKWKLEADVWILWVPTSATSSQGRPIFSDLPNPAEVQDQKLAFEAIVRSAPRWQQVEAVSTSNAAALELQATLVAHLSDLGLKGSYPGRCALCDPSVLPVAAPRA